MKAVISVIGQDGVGIIAKVSNKCNDRNANILDISQNVFDDTFAMIMVVDVSQINCEFASFAEEFELLGKELGLVIHVTHSDLFNSMHRI